MKKTFMIALVLTFGICAMGISTVIAGDYECGPEGTGTPGYWKNHPEEWEDVVIQLGTETYNQAQALAIMDGPVRGNKWNTMFKAYVATYLNIEIGNCPPCCYWGDNSCGLNEKTAKGWLASFQYQTKVRANSEAWQASHGEAEYFCLDKYNNGELNMPSRDDLE